MRDDGGVARGGVGAGVRAGRRGRRQITLWMRWVAFALLPAALLLNPDMLAKIKAALTAPVINDVATDTVDPPTFAGSRLPPLPPVRVCRRVGGGVGAGRGAGAERAPFSPRRPSLPRSRKITPT